MQGLVDFLCSHHLTTFFLAVNISSAATIIWKHVSVTQIYCHQIWHLWYARNDRYEGQRSRMATEKGSGFHDCIFYKKNDYLHAHVPFKRYLQYSL